MSLSERDEMIMRDIEHNPKGNNTKKGYKEFKKSVEVYLKDQLNSYIGKISEEDIIKREYVNDLIATILLEHNKKYKNTEIELLGRYKSDESFKTKTIHRMFKKDFDRPIDDIVGFRIVIESTKTLLPKESELNKEREKNLELLRVFYEFKENNLNDIGDLKISKEEYLLNLQALLKAIQQTLPKEAINLIDLYKKKEKIVKEKIDYLSINKDTILTKEDLHISAKEFSDSEEEKSDFEVHLEDFEARIDDKMYYQILVNQMRTVLKQSELIDNLEVKILSEKSKITENGYVAKFIKLSTLAGEIEVQLQTKNQYLEGVAGLAAHLDYKYQIPTQIPENLEDEAQIREFRSKTLPKLPEYFSAKIDCESQIEPAVIIRAESDYSALKKLYQVSKDSHLKEDIKKYLRSVYKVRRILFENHDSSVESIQRSDIDDFINSDRFKMLQDIKNSKRINETKDDESR